MTDNDARGLTASDIADALTGAEAREIARAFLLALEQHDEDTDVRGLVSRLQAAATFAENLARPPMRMEIAA